MMEKFEDRLTKLEEIVNKLETSNLSLDETLTLFKQGKELVKSLSSELETAKNKITEITSSDK